MPIAVKDFEWQQSEQMLYITVPLKGVARNKVDILSTEVYIKVSEDCRIVNIVELATDHISKRGFCTTFPFYDRSSQIECANCEIIFIF